MKRVCSFFLVVVLFDLAWAGSSPTTEKKEGPFVIHDISLDPQNPQIVYAATSNYGILKSTDGGATWTLSNRGLRSYTHHAIVVDPRHPQTLYAGAWGGGVSKSVDQGLHWTEANNGLGNTAIEDLALDEINPEKLYAATTSGVFKSPDGGTRWIPFSEGLPVSKIEIFQRLMVLSTGPIELLLGTSQGLFKRERDAPVWKAVNGIMQEQHVTAFAFHPKTHFLYAGTIKNGIIQSQDGGNTWTPLGGEIKKTWVSDIALDPSLPEVIYASTRGNGILKSQDGGGTWQEINTGLPVKDIRSLAIDPKTPKIFYAGTTHEGLAKTSSAGKEWFRLQGYPLLSITEIIASLSGPDGLQENSPPPSIPPEFFKCNQCHGWADSLLNAKNTYWRVSPNKRDWGPTVGRMSIRAHLTAEESDRILNFLTMYTQRKQ